MSENLKRLLFMFVFALMFYVGGASFIESFVNYPTWKLIGANEFQNYHNALSSLIIRLMVLPWLVEIVLTILLVWFRPPVIPPTAIVAALTLNLIALVSTIFIQIPIQTELGENGLSLYAIDKLIETDPIRWLALIIKAIVYLWMMSLVVKRLAAAAAGRNT
jgi:hypothetical protein